MAVINRIPPGLLGFLGLKSGGQNPRDIGNVIAPVFDLLRWYLIGEAVEVSSAPVAFQLVANEGSTTHQITATTPPNIAGLVTAGQLEVPNNELWYVDRWSVNWVLNAQAGASINVAMITTPPGQSSSARMPATLGGWSTSDAAIARAGHVAMTAPIWLKPGTTMALLNEGYIDGGAGVNVNTQMRITRIGPL